jgi:hypothetical protein
MCGAYALREDCFLINMRGVYRTSSFRREIGMRSGPYTGGAVLLPWDAIDLRVRRKLLRARPIAAENRRAETWRMLAIAAACGLALVIVSGSGFGQLFHRCLVDGPWFVVPYGVLLAGVVLPVAWLARRIFSRGSWLPYDRALLALDAIEATPKGLIVRPFGDARLASMKDSVIEIAYVDGSTFRIRAPQGSELERDWLDAEAILERASLTTDDAYRALVDPFHELRGERGLRSHPRAKLANGRIMQRRLRMDAAVACALLAISCVVGGLLVDLRNRLSDDAAFEYARSQDEVELYDEYLKGPARHRSEVRDVLLPRVVLNDAERGGVNELADYLARFPHSKFDAEARAALARACRQVSATYLWAARSNGSRLDDAVTAFTRDNAACAPYRAEVTSAYFEARRREIRGRPGIQPALRDVLLGLVDEMDHGRSATIHVVRDDHPYQGWTFGFAHELDLLTGGATATFVAPARARDTTSLVIQDERVLCPAGTRPHFGALTAHFTLFVHDEKRAEWRSTLRDDFGLFAAATSTYSDVEACVPLLP